MITTTQQKNKLQKQIDNLRQRLDSPPKSGVPEHMALIGKSQLQERIDELEFEIDDYNRACEANIAELSFETYADMLRMPIVLRLASGQSIAAFADNMGISESQLKRYEATEYASAPAHTVDRILAAFDLQISGQVRRAS
ncbi:MAG: helix-turn-helix domain-containing protein [Cellvibrionaceae bacterium]